jgi:hypothetical protein
MDRFFRAGLLLLLLFFAEFLLNVLRVSCQQPLCNNNCDPDPDGLSRIGLSRPARRSLTFRPACSLNRTRYSVPSEASTDWLPPPPLRLLPAGANRRQVEIPPTENRRLFTAHNSIAFLGELLSRIIWSSITLDDTLASMPDPIPFSSSDSITCPRPWLRACN